jgi:uncharacterized membrane protein YedE/YeeE
MIFLLTTLAVGIAIGYVGQRSRMCFIGGIRDFFLIRDTYLLRGLAAFALTAWLAFPLAHLIHAETARFAPATDFVTIALMVAAGFGIGYASTLANGCPLRQHVLAAQGVKSSIAYLAGFYIGTLLFHAWISPALARLLP